MLIITWIPATPCAAGKAKARGDTCTHRRCGVTAQRDIVNQTGNRRKAERPGFAFCQKHAMIAKVMLQPSSAWLM
jgi:hypothetical protein